jgi:hypothetical protein
LGKVKCEPEAGLTPDFAVAQSGIYLLLHQSPFQRFGHLFMRQIAVAVAMSVSALTSAPSNAAAEMGPCRPATFDLICGSGDGAARAVVKTISPSKRLAFAWRLANKPPTDRPEESDPNLQNLIVRITDGAVLAKSLGSYWDLSTKIAKAYLITAWSPDSRLLVKVEQRAGFASAELFSFLQDDSAIGPFELVKLIEPAMLALMQGVKDKDNYQLVFTSHPAMTVDDQGLLHANVFTRDQDSVDGPVYDVTVQIIRATDSLDAKVVSITPHTGASVSVIVH